MNPITQDPNLSAAPLDVPTAITQRRSIKAFKSDPIPPERLWQVVDLTVAAPSSWNLQDWRIVLVQDESQRTALSEAADATASKKARTPIYDQALQNEA